jgi:dihydroxyacid dehydratase/phosphogluconate dehydratase
MPELRSNFEPGTSRWATRRAQWRALGLTDEDMAKPKVAIVNSSSQLAICFSHLDEIARRARRAVEQAGGVAFEVRTAAPSDFITSAGHRGGYILSARDLIACDIEHAVLGPGVCAGLGTANTMHLACEALGMALPGSTPVRANSEPMWRAVEQAGQRIVAMIGEDLRSRDILTPAARSPGPSPSSTCPAPATGSASTSSSSRASSSPPSSSSTPTA